MTGGWVATPDVWRQDEDWIGASRGWACRLLLDRDLAPAARIVGLAIAPRTDRFTGRVRLRPPSWQVQLGMSRSEVRDGVEELLDRGYLIRDPGPGQSPTRCVRIALPANEGPE